MTKKITTLFLCFALLCSCGNSNSNSENNVSPDEKNVSTKSNLIEINYVVEFRDGKPYNGHCNYGNSDYSYRGGGYTAEYLSGTITIPKGKMWIYKDVQIADNCQSMPAVRVTLAIRDENFINGYKDIVLTKKDFNGVTLFEGQSFKIGWGIPLTAINGSPKLGVKVTFVEMNI